MGRERTQCSALTARAVKPQASPGPFTSRSSQRSFLALSPSASSPSGVITSTRSDDKPGVSRSSPHPRPCRASAARVLLRLHRCYILRRHRDLHLLAQHHSLLPFLRPCLLPLYIGLELHLIYVSLFICICNLEQICGRCLILHGTGSGTLTTPLSVISFAPRAPLRRRVARALAPAGARAANGLLLGPTWRLLAL